MSEKPPVNNFPIADFSIKDLQGGHDFIVAINNRSETKIHMLDKGEDIVLQTRLTKPEILDIKAKLDIEEIILSIPKMQETLTNLSTRVGNLELGKPAIEEASTEDTEKTPTEDEKEKLLGGGGGSLPPTPSFSPETLAEKTLKESEIHPLSSLPEPPALEETTISTTGIHIKKGKKEAGTVFVCCEGCGQKYGITPKQYEELDEFRCTNPSCGATISKDDLSRIRGHPRFSVKAKVIGLFVTVVGILAVYYIFILPLL